MKSALAAGGIALAAGVVTLTPALVGVFYDDGLYAGLATALASGLGYVHPHLPGAPAAVHYPPLYPLVLAPIFGALPLDAAALAGKLLNLALGALAAGLVAWHATRVELLGPNAPRWLAAALVAAAATAIPVLVMQSVLFAEPLFAVLLATAVILADRGGSPWLVGVAAALALLTRSIGVAVGVGIACFLLVLRAPPPLPSPPWRRVAAAVLPVAVAGVGWGLWVLTHERGIDPALAVNYGSYLEVLRQAGLSALGVSVPDLPRPLAALTLGWLPWRWLYLVIATAALGVGLYGLALLTRRSAIGFTLICYLVILAVWPYTPDRFLWAVLPWLVLAWAAGAFALWRQVRLRVPVAILAAAVAGGYLQYEIRGFAGRWWDAQARGVSATFADVLPVLVALPPDAVVASDDEALVWLYTRRRSVPLFLERYRGREIVVPTPAEHRAYLERMGVTHLLLASPTSPSAGTLRGLAAAYPGWLAVAYRWPGETGRWLFAVRR
ncbi:MAG TPA: hypothetical protein VGQ06_09750 [Gemmatimonadales bacterium]|nr:hypothetical protein [Gemmatimonadales bacterium]